MVGGMDGIVRGWVGYTFTPTHIYTRTYPLRHDGCTHDTHARRPRTPPAYAGVRIHTRKGDTRNRPRPRTRSLTPSQHLYNETCMAGFIRFFR